MIREFYRHRDLLSLLVVREIRIRYARAFLGMAWALFVPLVMMLIFTALNFGRLIPEGNPYRGLPYAAFAYCGLLFWTHFATSLTQGTSSLVVAAGLIKKCAFPREMIPFSKILAAVLDLAVGAIFLGILVVWHGLGVGWPLLLVPVVFLLQLLFTAGVVLVLSSANMFFRDVNYLVQVGVILLMFATSVVYPVTPAGPTVGAILALNPMSTFLDAYREIVLLGRWPGLELLNGALGAYGSLALGLLLFRKLSPHFAEEV
ncbi:MAG: ABC transporter permease [Planctomycetota bacterium]|jgi:ABC-type polysaccharide/polyol phosphate export permease